MGYKGIYITGTCYTDERQTNPTEHSMANLKSKKGKHLNGHDRQLACALDDCNSKQALPGTLIIRLVLN